MGMNAIRREGYADAKESGLRKGCGSSRDFDGEDVPVASLFVPTGKCATRKNAPYLWN